jgi:hypothetical protein
VVVEEFQQLAAVRVSALPASGDRGTMTMSAWLESLTADELNLLAAVLIFSLLALIGWIVLKLCPKERIRLMDTRNRGEVKWKKLGLH